MLALTGCKGGDDKKSGDDDTSEDVPFIPEVQDSPLKTAYDACVALANKAESESEYTFEGVVVAKTRNTVFVQKGYCGIQVYGYSGFSTASVGKSVSVTSTLTKYNGIVETKTVSAGTIGEDAQLETKVEILSANQLGQLRQNIMCNAKLKFVSSDGDWTPYVDSSNKGHAALVTCKVLNHNDDEVADTVIKFDKDAYESATATVVNGMQEGDVFTVDNIVTTAFSTSGDATVNQLLFCGTSSYAKL